MSSAHEQYYDQDRSWARDSWMADLDREMAEDYRLAMTEHEEYLHEQQDESIDEDDSVTPIDHDFDDVSPWDLDTPADRFVEALKNPYYGDGEDF